MFSKVIFSSDQEKQLTNNCLVKDLFPRHILDTVSVFFGNTQEWALLNYRVSLKEIALTKRSKLTLGEHTITVKKTADQTYEIAKSWPNGKPTSRKIEKPIIDSQTMDILVDFHQYTTDELLAADQLLQSVSNRFCQVDHRRKKIYINENFYNHLHSLNEPIDTINKLVSFLFIEIIVNAKESTKNNELVAFLKNNQEIDNLYTKIKKAFIEQN